MEALLGNCQKMIHHGFSAEAAKGAEKSLRALCEKLSFFTTKGHEGICNLPRMGQNLYNPRVATSATTDFLRRRVRRLKPAVIEIVSFQDMPASRRDRPALKPLRVLRNRQVSLFSLVTCKEVIMSIACLPWSPATLSRSHRRGWDSFVATSTITGPRRQP